MSDERAWSLESARALMPDVRDRTQRAVDKVEALSKRREALPEASTERVEVEQDMQRAISRWLREMEALGLEVKGLWLIDFDNGSGYYCWRWPEAEVAWFHGYDDGFDGRVRIQ